jgi:hypothetical protein
VNSQIVLLADEGRNHHEIGRELEISLKMARLWRKRWIEGQEKEIPVAERLCDGAILDRMAIGHSPHFVNEIDYDI